jgi:hypothetical protein
MEMLTKNKQKKSEASLVSWREKLELLTSEIDLMLRHDFDPFVKKQRLQEWLRKLDEDKNNILSEKLDVSYDQARFLVFCHLQQNNNCLNSLEKIEKQNDHITSLYLKAQYFFYQEQYDLAEGLFDKIANQDKKIQDIYGYLAVCAFMNNHPAKAILNFRKALVLRSNLLIQYQKMFASLLETQADEFLDENFWNSLYVFLNLPSVIADYFYIFFKLRNKEDEFKKRFKPYLINQDPCLHSRLMNQFPDLMRHFYRIQPFRNILNISDDLEMNNQKNGQIYDLVLDIRPVLNLTYDFHDILSMNGLLLKKINFMTVLDLALKGLNPFTQLQHNLDLNHLIFVGFYDLPHRWISQWNSIYKNDDKYKSLAMWDQFLSLYLNNHLDKMWLSQDFYLIARLDK